MKSRVFLLVVAVALIASILAALIEQREHPSLATEPTTTLSKLVAKHAGSTVYEASEFHDAPIYNWGGFVRPKYLLGKKKHYMSGSVTVEGKLYQYSKQFPDDAEFVVYLVENVSSGKRSWAVIRIP